MTMMLGWMSQKPYFLSNSVFIFTVWNEIHKSSLSCFSLREQHWLFSAVPHPPPLKFAY
ncbi:hypothetical protein RchiOBHm_Chr5g0058121 [Rosa chinensis]|uniref:Uncharacterized protein n=1 Tax=Rosa chinensis TaxID=74649 RepID=A0A2P6QH26_ROSCH|nr:hypothetical protein RchiOBHm_Chr5g0058121 [Rosa chinensis]